MADESHLPARARAPDTATRFGGDAGAQHSRHHPPFGQSGQVVELRRSEQMRPGDELNQEGWHGKVAPAGADLLAQRPEQVDAGPTDRVSAQSLERGGDRGWRVGLQVHHLRGPRHLLRQRGGRTGVDALPQRGAERTGQLTMPGTFDPFSENGRAGAFGFLVNDIEDLGDLRCRLCLGHPHVQFDDRWCDEGQHRQRDRV